MKILIIANFPGWAFDNIAQAIKKYGSFDYDIIYEAEHRRERLDKKPAKINFDQYDRILNLGVFQDWVNLPHNKTACVFWERGEMDGFRTDDWYRAIVTSDINYEYIKNKENVVKVKCGYDPDIFHRFAGQQSRIPEVIGWVGSKTAHKEKKGFDQFYLPIGSSFKLKPHLKETGTIPYNKMQSYYYSIDALVVTSSWEGNPLPLIEALACGTLVISTRVGVAPELLPKDQIVERDPQAFINRLKQGNLKAPSVYRLAWDKLVADWEEVLI
jgi:hypothetical protein